MSDAEVQTSEPQMTVGKAIGVYAACLIALFVLISLTANIKSFPGSAAFVGYLALGFLLNRVVLRGLIEWHPMYNTLQNVSSAKLGMLALWPIRYPVLFFQFLVNKHL